MVPQLVACENTRFSSLFAAGDVCPQWRRARRNGCFRRLHSWPRKQNTNKQNNNLKKKTKQITSTQQRDVWIWVISRTKINDTAYHQVHWSKSKKHFLCQLKRPHSNSTKLHGKIPSWARTKLTPGRRQSSEFRGLFPYFNALRNSTCTRWGSLQKRRTEFIWIHYF